jgi:3,4-dihydroxy 2-butanone 4-phosphate synthase/GTP cyclohydrolase II
LKNYLKNLADGKMLILVDDSKQLTEAALICLADYTTPEVVNKMVTHARGMVSISMARSIAEQAGLSPQKGSFHPEQSSRNYTVSIDAEETTTGISAYERSISIKKLAKIRTVKGFKKPGHIFPVIADERGLYGHVSVIEGAIDCAEIIGVQDAMVTVCDILNQDGGIGDESHSLKLAQKLHVPVIYLSEVLKYKLTKDGLLASRTKQGINIDGISFQMRRYELQGKEYAIFFDEFDINQVKKEIVMTKHWLMDNIQESLELLPNYQSTFSKAIKQLNHHHCLIIQGEREARHCSMVYEVILHDLEVELNGRVQDLSVVTA